MGNSFRPTFLFSPFSICMSTPFSPASDVPHVVIVGAGFAGLEAAKTLGGAPVDVTLVDRNNYHKFQPLLYEVAMAGLEPDDIAHNVRNIFQGEDNVRFRLGTVVGVDADARRLDLRDGGPLSYDYLILAAGAVSTDFGIPGVREHGYPLKNIPDAVELRNRVLRQFERYDRQSGRVDAGMLTFVIVGGGPTGVEMAGALVELFDTLNDDFRGFDTRAQSRCVLLEMQDELLPPYEASLRRYTRQVLERRGVDVRTNTAVDTVEADAVHLNDGTEIRAETLVWAAGIEASPVADVLGVEQARDGRVVVDRQLRIPGLDRVYAVGDMAAIEGEEGYEPQLAQVAIQSGRHAAEHVRHSVEDDELLGPFSYRDYGQMATIGRNAAVAELASGMTFKGFLAWLVWVVLHIAKLVGFRNRMSAFVDWVYNYFTYSRSARLILDVVPSLDEGRRESETLESVSETLTDARSDQHANG